MARKLDSEEEQLFVAALQKEAASTNDAGSEQFLLRVAQKRDTALRLTPELAALFSEDPPGPVGS